jgi:predicted nuclease of predicted toxin-antitoxin system
MKLKEFSYLADENIAPATIEFLRSYLNDVISIHDVALVSAKDVEILDFATQQKRIVITQDSDFGTIFFRYGVRPTGIIYVRPGHVAATITNQTLKAIFEADIEVRIPFIIVAENQNGIVKTRIRLL